MGKHKQGKVSEEGITRWLESKYGGSTIQAIHGNVTRLGEPTRELSDGEIARFHFHLAMALSNAPEPYYQKLVAMLAEAALVGFQAIGRQKQPKSSKRGKK